MYSEALNLHLSLRLHCRDRRRRPSKDILRGISPTVIKPVVDNLDSRSDDLSFIQALEDVESGTFITCSND